MTLPLNKTLHPDDYLQLPKELEIVDIAFTKAAEQHPARRWEYALAIDAFNRWEGQLEKNLSGPTYDVGGSGSPFYVMLDPYQVHVVDPREIDGRDLQALLREGPRLGRAVFCLSVIEHIERGIGQIDRFCYHLASLVAPGGLLVLTMDYATSSQDTFHFHWMRERIVDPQFYRWLIVTFEHYGFKLFGGIDQASHQQLVYHGPQVYDYTFASLVLRKRA